MIIKRLDILVATLVSAAFSQHLMAAEDINNGYEDYTINRKIEDLTAKDKASANRIIYGCYLGCHRPAKEEVPETLSPKLEGFDAQYFLNQWVDMDNERHAGISSQMKEIVYANPVRDMASTAIVLGERTMSWNPDPEVMKSEAYARGKTKYDGACKFCHGEQGASTNPKYPPLKGQMPAYLFEQLTSYRDGKRANRNAPIMMPFAKMLSEEDYKDIIAYVSGKAYTPVERREFITGIGMPPVEGFVLPDTGQNQNFTDTFGEDSDYPRNPPSYTISESGKVVVDNNTKLMWERESSRIWMTAVEGQQYCDSLELDGYKDWRFPLMKELQSIADMGEFRPALNTDIFSNMPRLASGIWTFPISDHPDHVWHIGFPDAHIMGQHTASTKLVRCVRADNGAAYHNMRYVDNGNGTVTEKITNRMWQQNIDYQRRNWEESIKYCENLDYAGYDDWRLPNIKEMVSIVNYNKTSPAIDEEFFPNTPVKYFFWTSTSDVAGPTLFIRPLSKRKKDQTPEMLDLRHTGDNEGWAMGYQIGSGYGMQKDNQFYNRCIRTP
ncbi:DUF1566 domain-containing protein [Photobacterium sp. SDRW27]|uniref:Lcl domain-containing protein n=1 Tax=Photobacterium obscurum TaxID=2829490 RepID=UPI002243A55B|nr:DUF1566 domain-containing protein [Photobacterium obscurum]MCW8328380.1 DUF1566 domain-containing protein [Photobacterium obscurum]